MGKNRRRIVALLAGATVLLLPFLRVRGRGAVRFDLPTLSLHFFGAVVPIDEFHLVLWGALFLVALTLLVTVVFGRLWCGWLCPSRGRRASSTIRRSRSLPGAASPAR